ncbi:xanthine dehydrogenase family protein molybdopterin-binding subunit [Dactylosporangium roseum]|uniref:Xanthine dehydrogenase family protein molybdopterin-binding subunit n=1 Tax=Dactylosporangium roseum TaxID=47989 RepID=A0ABY5YVL6_9ACTN|nr:xanthine dehydrogenase family protein molybdopterin-binding subunit [Dactylosporangium roseum]UWZ33788.1 xanthine dehydrogenase family protein molybdopterin-binding subunit [Dactylosporangium roseum]
MTTVERPRVLGTGTDRVDGPRKAAGGVPYSSDVSYPGMVHAALVRSTIAAGRIAGIDTSRAEAAPGVLAVITPDNAPRIERAPDTPLWRQPPPPLQRREIVHHGQYVGVVVAETVEEATAAARLVGVAYEPTDPVLSLDDPRAVTVDDPFGSNRHRGDVVSGFAAADVVFDGEYTTPDETNNPMGLFCTVAAWDGDRLTVHDATQWPGSTRAALAGAFSVPEAGIRVLAPYVGGGFGAGLRVWPHTVLAAMAARVVGRPVKLALTRPQMFTGVGHRPATVQRIRIGARDDGTLTAIEHESVQPVAVDDDNIAESVTTVSAVGYACPNVANIDRQRRLNIPVPTSMRGPGDAQGHFALECAMDELAYRLGIDPVELRLRNYADEHPQLGLPWSSKAQRECYEVGAERFGWWDRNPAPRSMRRDGVLVGWGMAGVSFFWFQAPCDARASIDREGRAFVRSAATDIGTGTYTVMTQLSADRLGLRPDQVRVGLGDTDLPAAPPQGGSGMTASLGSAIHAAAQNLVQAFLDLVADDVASPLRGLTAADVTAVDGRIQRDDDPTRGESYREILDRHDRAELSADGSSVPAKPEETGLAPAGPFAARFVEVHVDPDLDRIKVARLVSVVDAGRILNRKTARSQIVGGTVGGIGMALLEETVTDPTGRIANATLGDYLIPVNADVPDLDVVFVGEPDRFNPVGVKGVGEIGLVGVAPAIANAAFHATGHRVRSLPLTLDKLL